MLCDMYFLPCFWNAGAMTYRVILIESDGESRTIATRSHGELVTLPADHQA